VGFLLVQAEHLFDEFEPDEGHHGQGDDPPPGQLGEFPDFEKAQGDQGDEQEDEGHGYSFRAAIILPSGQPKCVSAVTVCIGSPCPGETG
jgi:hypothetical protein